MEKKRSKLSLRIGAKDAEVTIDGKDIALSLTVEDALVVAERLVAKAEDALDQRDFISANDRPN